MAGLPNLKYVPENAIGRCAKDASHDLTTTGNDGGHLLGSYRKGGVIKLPIVPVSAQSAE